MTVDVGITPGRRGMSNIRAVEANGIMEFMHPRSTA